MTEALSLVSVPLALGVMGLMVHLVEILAAHIKGLNREEREEDYV